MRHCFKCLLYVTNPLPAGWYTFCRNVRSSHLAISSFQMLNLVKKVVHFHPEWVVHFAPE